MWLWTLLGTEGTWGLRQVDSCETTCEANSRFCWGELNRDNGDAWKGPGNLCVHDLETASVVWPRDANRRSISVKLVTELGRKGNLG